MINVQNLSFTYPGTSTPALHDITFTIEAGEIFGFLGPSGAGKSTTQKILIRLLRGFRGHVTILGRDLRDWDDNLYEQVGVCFELPNHYGKLTAIENLRYFARLYSRPTLAPETVLDMVGLSEDGHLLASQYSKGMKIRLNLARALLHQPQLLFLDEPTAGLDPVNARRIKDLIKAQKEAGRTIFLTTHDMNIAEELCDRVAFIIDGQIRLIDSPRELKLQYGKKLVRVEYLVNGHLDACEFALDGLADNRQFHDVLRLPVQTIHTQEASLEQIFIQVTGRNLN
ncbi:MAG TPA: ABC transporter ATP-binding protein [Chloroflexus aurantiacus]|jgi:fluoroquinolone transport system ATP-binding protein|uniref:ABC transporter related n=1 Tax=Chloroflexus aurantiacus (strain ATCC 29366 / DSM 635 / J-10-fl) TaxID=324602 RepID=A9WJL4_CHLAA|nr:MULTISPECIES: ABC transporter ATP-binding protein [Chloroflexus]ABY35918.1 ABC transporter related [Chloroflexus aurantiacus J-10-fl]GIV91580.1 MAG: ATP-binding protein [Chloroflexus sp.]HBW69214.1 ABC transporter ATP-binding protein [Chloroflexus aurantiacus]